MRSLVRVCAALLSLAALGAAAPDACKDASKWDASLVVDLRSKGTEGCTTTEAWDYKGKQTITKTSKLPKDGELTKQSGRGTGGPYTCDHIVELAMIKRIMNMPGGACDQAEALRKTGATDARTRLLEIRKVANARTNMYFFDSVIEGFKGKLVNFQAGIPGATNPLPTMNYWEHTALHDFAFGAGRPGTKAHATALLIDAEIVKQFSKASTTSSVAAEWLKWTAAVKAAWLVAEAKAQQDLKDLQCTPPSSPKPLQARSPSLPSRPRFIGVRSMFTPYSSDGIHSSLVTRARRSAARSGPNAPKAPSCPMKGQPPKKTVPKSKAPVRPKPATKPRQPTTRPAPRAPAPNKRAVRRPATRPRRAPGKAAQPRRTTPKRKPKPVPKPTRRPTGKARPRRRR